MNTLLIPDSVQEIGNNAFEGTEVNTIAIGEGIEDIGDDAFSGVTGAIMCPQEKKTYAKVRDLMIFLDI